MSPKYMYLNVHNWGEPERAPHKCEVRAVCLSVRMFMTGNENIQE